jgi:hypothetical protein
MILIHALILNLQFLLAYYIHGIRASSAARRIQIVVVQIGLKMIGRWKKPSPRGDT